VTPRRFIATAVPLLFLPTLVVGCKDDKDWTHEGTRRCVDRTHHPVDDSKCKDVSPSAGTSSPFFWYYMGQLNGGQMGGGHYAPRNGYYYSSPSGHNFSPSGSHFGSSSPNSGTSVRGLSGGSHFSGGS
jgi:hypothetical protein